MKIVEKWNPYRNYFKISRINKEKVFSNGMYFNNFYNSVIYNLKEYTIKIKL
jgi:hypothetical protein